MFALSIVVSSVDTQRVYAANPCGSLSASKKPSCNGGYSIGHAAGKNEANGGTRVSISVDANAACNNGISGIRNFDRAACKKGYEQGVKDGRNTGENNGSGGGNANDSPGSDGNSPGPGGVNDGAEAGPGAGLKEEAINCKKYSCEDPAAKAANPDAECNSAGCDLIKTYVNPTIRVMSILVSIVAVISIIVGGLQYSSAGSDPQKISSAKDRISKTLIAYVAYLFLAGFLEFLIPGGIFNR